MSSRETVELVTAVSVVLGFVFVGIEIDQNTSAAQAQSRQELAAQNIDFLMRIVEDESLSELWAAEWTHEFIDDLNRTERARLFQTTIALMIRLENVYLQYDRELLGEASLRNYGMDQNRFEQPGFWVFWSGLRATFDADFVTHFESVNAKVD